MSDFKTLNAVFAGGRSSITASLMRYDYGQILKIIGIDLPSAFEAHFSDSTDGTSITQIGHDNEVTIPDDFLQGTNDKIYCWIYLHDGETDGSTEYTITIPVKPRASITEDVPTPEEQSAISEAIVALNEGVERAEAAAEIFTTASATAETLPEGSEATATYAEGLFTFGIPKGDKGDKGDTGATGATGESGRDGRDGIDGVSPTVSLSKSGNVTTMTVTDGTGTHVSNIIDGADGQDGQDGINGKDGSNGQDGVSPTVTTSKSGKVTTITITDKTGTHTATVNDGADGQDGEDGHDYVLTQQDKADIAALVLAELPTAEGGSF